MNNELRTNEQRTLFPEIRFTLHEIRNCPLHLSRALYKSTLFMQNEPKFRKSQMNVNKVLTMNYEKEDTWWTGKKRTQTNPISEKPKMNVNSIVTKYYENICPCGVPKNKPNQTQFQKRSVVLTKDKFRRGDNLPQK